MAKEKAVKIIEIHPLNKKSQTITIVGDTPLLIHRLSAKLKIEFENRNEGKAQPKKQNRDRHNEFCEALYWLDKNGNEIPAGKDPSKHRFWGFPASGLKKAAIYACRSFKGVEMTKMRGAFHVLGKFIMIEGNPRIQQEQGCDGVWVREGGKGPGTGTPNIRYRAEFPEWKATVRITHNADMVTVDQIFNLINAAGFSVGLGEDRPDKAGGSYGMFHVE